jgi:hypothetical protein
MDSPILTYLVLIIIAILAIAGFTIITKYLQRKEKDFFFDHEDKGIFIDGLNEAQTEIAPLAEGDHVQGPAGLGQSNATNPVASALKTVGPLSIVLALVLMVISVFLLTENERLVLLIPVLISFILSGIICIRLEELIKLIRRNELNTVERRRDKTPNYSERIRAAEKCQKNLFDRLKSYGEMDETNYHDYNTTLRGYTELLKATAELCLKMGEYYAAMGDKQKAKAIYRHVITNYTEDVFKSCVIRAEFALKDLEDQ